MWKQSKICISLCFDNNDPHLRILLTEGNKSVCALIELWIYECTLSVMCACQRMFPLFGKSIKFTERKTFALNCMVIAVILHVIIKNYGIQTPFVCCSECQSSAVLLILVSLCLWALGMDILIVIIKSEDFKPHTNTWYFISKMLVTTKALETEDLRLDLFYFCWKT